ncbi:MAG: VOC family protein [Actinomycetota bacterium]
MPKVTHFEIPADDLDRAKAFYASVFDWELVTVPMENGEYTTIVTTPVDPQTQRPTEPGGINGGLTGRDWVPGPVITIDVESIDDSLKQIESKGGTTVTPRTPIPGMGAFAYFKDPEGNQMGLFETTA